MSTTKSKTELVRLAWIAALRREGDRQCHSYGHGKHVCALQLLHGMMPLGDRHGSSLTETAMLAGLSERQAWIIVALNDGDHLYGFEPVPQIYEERKHTFSEIADVIEGWFAPAE